MKLKILIYLGKQRTKKEASQHTNQHNPAGHERKVKPTLNFFKYCKYTFLCIANTECSLNIVFFHNSLHPLPHAYIAVRDLQSSQRYASVQSFLLAGNFLYNQ